MPSLFLPDWRDARDWGWRLLALPFLLTVCTTLRLPGAPVGAGEVGLLMIGLVAVVLRRDRILRTLRAYRWLAACLLVYLVALAAGGVLSAHAGRLSAGWSHDVAGLLFASASGLLVLLLAGDSAHALSRLQRGVVAGAVLLSVAAFLLIIADYLIGRPVLSPALNANLWWHGRFSAWSTDPNQWGLLLLITIMLLVLLPGPPRPLLLALVVWLLLEVRSDAALAGLLAFAVAYAVVALWRRPDLRRGALTAVAVVTVVFGMFRLVADHYPPSPVLRVIGAVAGVEPPPPMLKKRQRMQRTGNPLFIGAGGDKMGQRMALWRHSLEAWRHSPVVGLGPGAYAGTERPFQERESHSLLLQVLVNAGLVGLLAILAGLGLLAHRLWRSPAAVPWLAGLAGLLVQGLGHYLMRHPLFWLFIVLLVWQAVHGSTIVATHEEEGSACPDY